MQAVGPGSGKWFKSCDREIQLIVHSKLDEVNGNIGGEAIGRVVCNVELLGTSEGIRPQLQKETIYRCIFQDEFAHRIGCWVIIAIDIDNRHNLIILYFHSQRHQVAEWTEAAHPQLETIVSDVRSLPFGLVAAEFVAAAKRASR